MGLGVRVLGFDALAVQAVGCVTAMQSRKQRWHGHALTDLLVVPLKKIPMGLNVNFRNRSRVVFVTLR